MSNEHQVWDWHEKILAFISNVQRLHESRNLKAYKSRYKNKAPRLVLFENNLLGEVYLQINEWPSLQLMNSSGCRYSSREKPISELDLAHPQSLDKVYLRSWVLESISRYITENFSIMWGGHLLVAELEWKHRGCKKLSKHGIRQEKYPAKKSRNCEDEEWQYPPLKTCIRFH